MFEKINSSKYALIALTAILVSISCHSKAQTGSQAFSGETSSIIPDKSCSEKPKNLEMTIVFDGKPESATFGWFYGKGTSTAEFIRISPTRFEVNYAVTRFNKLPPSSMVLLPTKEGFHVVVKDHIPEDKELRESSCFFEEMEADLKPLDESADNLKKRGKELFSADLIMAEGSDLLWGKKDYKAAIDRGTKALAIYDGIYEKWSKESINASAIIAFALMYQDRFDEALEVILPYRKALPDHDLLKEFVKKIQREKKKQDDLFRHDPDSKGDANLEPLV